MTSGDSSGAPRLKMADIARMAGVSTATVSRALAGNPIIPQALRERISAIASAQGYVINQQARGLRLQRTQTIGVVIPLGHESGQLITDPFFQEMVGRLADEITLRGFEVLLSKVAAPTPGWLDRMVQSHRSDGLLVIGQSDQHDALNAVADLYRPLVVWGGSLPDQRYCTVGVDNVAGARLAVEHLIGLGRRRIAFLGMPDAPEVGLRRQGYLAALAQAGLPVVPELSAPAHFTIDTAYQGVVDLIQSGVAFDAVFAASDVIALGAVRALSAAGRRVPADVSVVGFDDVAVARHSLPALTTIRQDLERGAREMVDLLFRRIDGEVASSVVMVPELIIRQT
jgi:DNA-binding LacI/PurR family transcriptional regulator